MLFRLACFAGGLVVAVTAPATAATLTATATTISSVFAAAKAGDTIRLSGVFGRTALANRSFATALTLDARGATFTDTLSLSSIVNVKLIGGHYGNAKALAPVGIRIFQSSGITVSMPIVVGNGTSSHGVDVAASSGITVDKGSFTGLKLGVGFVAVTNGRITGNSSVRASSDGFNIADSHNVLVSRNSCSGTVIYAAAHPDCVQLWSVAGHVPQSDIEISDNTATGATQGFTSFNGSDGGGDRLKFLRNRVDTSYPQGVACYECRDSQFIGNILTTQAGAQWQTRLNVIGGRNNLISGNSVAPYAGLAHATFGFDPAATLAFDADVPDFGRFDDPGFGDAAPAFVPGVVAATVPEPATWLLAITGFAVIGVAARRRRTLTA